MALELACDHVEPAVSRKRYRLPPERPADGVEEQLRRGARQASAAEVTIPSAKQLQGVHSMSSFSMNGSPTWTLGRSRPAFLDDLTFTTRDEFGGGYFDDFDQ